MTRWHSESCDKPTVVLTNVFWPRCETCGKSCPTLAELRSTQDLSGTSSLTIPPDERPGHMSLHWPDVVRYARGRSEELADDDDPHTADFVTEPMPRPPENVLSIYGPTLRAADFRLARLLPAQSESGPLHVTLETYSEDSHPEYETASYVWAGEDGDSSPSRAIFIGLYWDVLLQTRNCWSLLRFLQPLMGERRVWVDALCINQQNLEERKAQVARMRRIYERSSRVVAYLGDDIVTRTLSFPHYRPLGDITDASLNRRIFPEGHAYHGRQLDIKDLLARKYFTRIWIMQELLLPERAVFRVGNVEFRADTAILSRIRSVDWSKTHAPWFKYLAHKRIVDQDNFCEIYNLLRFARRCQASDPRDRLFGIIALVGDKQVQAQFAADYSISYRHFCIGLFGNWIINKGVYILLFKARTLWRSEDGAPSWLPDYSTPEAWDEILAPSHDIYPYHCSREFHMFIDNGTPPVNHISEAARNFRTRPRSRLPKRMKLVRFQDDDCMSTSSESHEDEDEKGKNYNFLAEEDSTRIYTFAASLLDPRTMTWHQEAYIRATTGALSINLVHLLKFDKEPTLVHSHQKYGCFFTLLDNHQEVSDCLYMTSNHRLDQSIQPESDHLFMLDGGTWDHENKDRKTLTNNNLMFLVLRADRPDLRVPRRFRLVTADVFLFRVQQKPKDYLYWKSHHMIKHDSVASRVQHEDGPGLEDSVACAVRSILDQVEYLANGDHSREQNRTSRPKRTPDVVRQHQGKYFRLEGVWQQIFPGIVSVGGLSRALLGLVRAMHLEKPPLLREVLVEAILQGNENVRADTDGDYIVLTIDADDWRSGIKHYYLLPVLTADEPEAYESQYRYIKNGRHALPRPRRFKPADTAFMELYFEIDWEWRWKGSHYVENWRPIAEWNLPGYRRRRFLSLIKRTLKEESQAEVRVRARKDQIYDYIVRDLCHMMPPLRAIMRAYEPRLSIDDTWRLVENGETKAQRRTGLPKTIGGVKMDGSTYRVEIL